MSGQENGIPVYVLDGYDDVDEWMADACDSNQVAAAFGYWLATQPSRVRFAILKYAASTAGLRIIENHMAMKRCGPLRAPNVDRDVATSFLIKSLTDRSYGARLWLGNGGT